MASLKRGGDEALINTAKNSEYALIVSCGTPAQAAWVRNPVTLKNINHRFSSPDLVARLVEIARLGEGALVGRVQEELAAHADTDPEWKPVIEDFEAALAAPADDA